METIIFYVILGVIAVEFLLERYLDYLNRTMWSDKLPDELKGIYDAEQYEKSQRYEKVNHRFSQFTSTFSVVLMLAFIVFGGFPFVDNIARGWAEHPIWVALIFFGLLFIASDLINMPFGIYATFKIEEDFGFNKTTPKIYALDKVKSYLVTAVLGGGIMALIVWFYMLTGTNFWLYTWAFITAFSIFMVMFHSNIIVPLFNKQTPLEEGELKTAIAEMAEKAGFNLDNIYVIDGSKRSTKANAYFTGFGAKKRIVLFDTLINDLSTEEIVAVLAHEIGHYKKKHVLGGLVMSVMQTGLMLFILSLCIAHAEMSSALGVDIPSFHVGLVTFGILYSPLSFIMGIGMNVFSRKNEFEADAFAAKYASGEELSNALKKLSVKNLSNLKPHPIYVFFHYSHPTLLQRLETLKEIK
ncbi:M48 family peptidase [Puteibacter caeruleilacunae]|nr:M48 family peptidase [Puteibacter caeruleilacunae]